MRILLSLLFVVLLTACQTSCALHNPHIVNGHEDPIAARKATVLVQVEASGVDENKKKVDASGMGTGWFLDWEDDRTVVVTAGHVCLNPGDKRGPDDSITVMKVKKFEIVVRGGDTYEAEVIKESDKDYEDWCLLAVRGYTPGVVMRLWGGDTEDLEFGADVWYVGFPGGHLSIEDGRINGYHEPSEDTEWKLGYLTVSIPAFFGASGSALLNEKGEVVGMLSAVYTRYMRVAYFVTVEYLREARKAAREWLRPAPKDTRKDAAESPPT